MFQDWQTVAVWLIILAALAYVGRRGWARIRSFRVGGKGQASAASCATGCGSCGDAQAPVKTNAAQPQKVLVQISGAGSARRRPK